MRLQKTLGWSELGLTLTVDLNSVAYALEPNQRVYFHNGQVQQSATVMDLTPHGLYNVRVDNSNSMKRINPRIANTTPAKTYRHAEGTPMMMMIAADTIPAWVAGVVVDIILVALQL